MKNKRYKFLSGVKKLVIVEGRNLTKSNANKISKKIRGYYCGSSEYGVKHKVRKPIKGKYCEKVRTKILLDR